MNGACTSCGAWRTGEADHARACCPSACNAVRVLQDWERIINALVIRPDRALEELKSDWTASLELADVLMRKYKLPFPVGQHFASEVVDYAKANNIRPLDFPYKEAQRIYRDAVKGGANSGDLPRRNACWPFRARTSRSKSCGSRAAAGPLTRRWPSSMATLGSC